LIIFRYLAKQVLFSMLSVTVVLLMVFLSGRFVRYLEQAATGRLSPEILLPILAYRLPEFLQMILPVGFLLGILLAYGRMYVESEMTVLHSCGMSDQRLLGMSLIFALFVSLIVGLMSLYITPWGFQQAKRLLVEQSKMSGFEILTSGRFQSFHSDERVTYISSISPDKKTLYEVYIAEPKSDVQIFAESGILDINSQTDEKYIILHNGTRYQGRAGEINFKVVSFDTYGLRIEDNEVNETPSSYDTISIPTQTLLTRNDNTASAELQWRISLPLSVPILCLIAVSMSPVNPRQGRFLKIFPAFLLYVFYLGLLSYARTKVEQGTLPTSIGLWSIHLIFFVLSLILFSREKLFCLFKRLLNKKTKSGVSSIATQSDY